MLVLVNKAVKRKMDSPLGVAPHESSSSNGGDGEDLGAEEDSAVEEDTLDIARRCEGCRLLLVGGSNTVLW